MVKSNYSNSLHLFTKVANLQVVLEAKMSNICLQPLKDVDLMSFSATQCILTVSIDSLLHIVCHCAGTFGQTKPDVTSVCGKLSFFPLVSFHRLRCCEREHCMNWCVRFQTGTSINAWKYLKTDKQTEEEGNIMNAYSPSKLIYVMLCDNTGKTLSYI